MKFIIDTLFNIDDEVYLGFANAVFKVKIKSIDVVVKIVANKCYPTVRYFFYAPSPVTHAYGVAVYATEEEAKARQKILQSISRYDPEELYKEDTHRIVLKDGEVLCEKYEPLKKVE